MLKQKLVYGARADAAGSVGFTSDVPRGPGFYEKDDMDIKKADGALAAKAEEVFEKTRVMFPPAY